MGRSSPGDRHRNSSTCQCELLIGISSLILASQCIQDVLPELVTLFDAMKDIDSPNQPSAAAALAKYEEICRSLSVEDLERHVEMIRWRDGTLFFRGSGLYSRY